MDKNNRGFTIVELMIAISVLSVILLLVSVGIIQISKTYYKGIVQANTQQAARALLQDVAESIQFGSFTTYTKASARHLGAAYPPVFDVQAYCFGTRRYSYIPIYQLNTTAATAGNPAMGNSKHVLWKDVDAAGTCLPLDVGQSSPPSSSSNGHELLGEHMRLTNFSIQPANPCSPTPTTGCNDNLYTVSVTVMYGDDDLIDKTNPTPSQWTCKPSGSAFAAAFCAKAELTTVIGKRLS